MTIERTQVLWLGPAPGATARAEFKRRNLTLTLTEGPFSDQDFANSRAVIFCFDPKQKGHSIGLLKNHATRAAEHGLLLIIQANTQEQIKQLQAHILDVPECPSPYPDLPRPMKLFSIKRPGYELAELTARHKVGPPYVADDKLQINGEPPEDDKDIFLLRRAFSDCRSITVQRLGGGHSGARVLAIYAEFQPGEAAPYPLPYLAKIDLCHRIITEFGNYDRFVNHSIPFGQRPNFELKRCLLGLTDGIMVGDFVDDSEPLSKMVKPYGARAIIHSLFDDVLRAWRQQAYVDNTYASLSGDVLSDIVEADQIKQKHVELAKAKFGATHFPADLAALLNQAATYQYRRGPTHGDLNHDNIRVRNGEAVLIDFYKTKGDRPLVADLASLEVAICFSIEADTKWNHDESGSYIESLRFKEWRRHIDTLFTFENDRFGLVPPLQERPCEHTWMWSACRQLRLMAYYVEQAEKPYAYILAAYLMRMAKFEEVAVDSPDSIVRAYAYCCAERMLEAMTPAMAAV